MINFSEILNYIHPISLVYITLLGIYFRIYINKRHNILEDKIDKGFKEILFELKSINQRLSRLEGAFYERGNWESRLTGTDHHTKSDRPGDDKHS